MTLGLQQAADFLGLHPSTLQERARAGKIPGAAKPGKRWVFVEDGLVAYLYSLSPCRSTGSEKSGTLTYRQNAVGLDAVLGLPTASRRKRTLKG